MNKYSKGRVIRSMRILDREFFNFRYVYWRHKPQHPSWLMSMPYRTLLNAVKSGILYKTKENKKCQPNSQ